MGRLPRPPRERQRRAAAVVAERAPAPSLLPGAARAREAPAGAVGARRRDRDRARRRPRLRRDADEAPPRREPRQQALGRDPRPLHRLRHARVEGTGDLGRPAVEAPLAPRAQREALRAVSGRRRSARRHSAGSIASRRSGSTASSRSVETALPPGFARRRRQGEAGEDGRLRRRRRALEGEARAHRDAPARPLPRRRRARLRRVGRGRAGAPRRDREARPSAAEERSRAPVLGAEPLGQRRARGVADAPRARRRGALRQGAVESLPPRHEAHPLP